MMAPWLTKQWQQLWQAKNCHRLPHALLLVGAKGTHKAKFANCFSQALLCQQGAITGEPCQQCHACRLVTAKTHPNVLWVEPEKAGAAIKVDQIRAVSEFVSHTSLQGEYRIVTIHPAEEMNMSAANALLKTLEEPAADALLVLISDQRHTLPATVLSRCQRVFFPGPTKEEVCDWLVAQPQRQDLFQGLVSMIIGREDPIKLANTLQHHDPIQMLDFILSWLVDLLKLQLHGEPAQMVNIDYIEQLRMLCAKTQVKLNLALMNSVQQLRRQCNGGINLNKQLMLESVFIQWMRCVECS